MNGADLLIRTAVSCGIETCFTNPGTTEMALVRALDGATGVRTILGLFEGVCAGAADGYGRMTGRPAMTLLHQGPGLANAIASFHNAQRARTPVLNVIGDHFTWHRACDPSLYLDIEALAAAVGWHRTCGSTAALSRDLADALMAALGGQIASLIVPHDHQLAESESAIADLPPPMASTVHQDAVDRALAILRNHPPTLLMLGGKALGRKGLMAAARIKAATGCDLFTEILPSCWDRGAGLPVVERTPYRPGEQAMLARYRGVVLAGMDEPLTFSGRRGFESTILRKDQEKVSLAGPHADAVDAMERLADALDAPAFSSLAGGLIAPRERPGLPEGALTVEKACQTLAALQPEGAIIVEEGITSCYAYYPVTKRVAPHTVLTPSGGTIGWGMAAALGAAVACPDRQVISFLGDGSAMYTVQALWTQAREGLHLTTLVLSNRAYNALRMQLAREGAPSDGPATGAVTELARPVLGWTALARGLGVPGVSVSTAEELARELRIAFAEPGPHLLELVLP